MRWTAGAACGSKVLSCTPFSYVACNIYCRGVGWCVDTERYIGRGGPGGVSFWVSLFVLWHAVLGSGGSKSRRIASPQSALARLLGGAVVDVALTAPMLLVWDMQLITVPGVVSFGDVSNPPETFDVVPLPRVEGFQECLFLIP